MSKYVVKVRVTDLEGKPMQESHLIQADGMSDAEARVIEYFSSEREGDQQDFEITSVTEKKISQIVFAKNSAESLKWFELKLIDSMPKAKPFTFLIESSTAENAIKAIQLEQGEKILSVVIKKFTRVAL